MCVPDMKRFLSLPLLCFALTAAISGALSGLAVALFRISITLAEKARSAIPELLSDNQAAQLISLLSICASATWLSAKLVAKFSPQASGSGIPHVESVLKGECSPPGWKLLAVKFFGGILSMGSGLALGREGPSIQISAVLSRMLAVFAKLDSEACRLIFVSGAGAGLSAAFNAPLAAIVFVFEELMKSFSRKLLLCAAISSFCSYGVVNLFFDGAVEFPIPDGSFFPLKSYPAIMLFGLLFGVVGIAYEKVILGMIYFAGRAKIGKSGYALLIGLASGYLCFQFPQAVGGGEDIVRSTLDGVWSSAPLILAVFFIFRLSFAGASYASAVPGGLFAPMLAVGAQGGFLLGILCADTPFSEFAPLPAEASLMGMAALFAAAVRAPLTGAILVFEMSGSQIGTLPGLLLASFAATIAPKLAGERPIYDLLSAPPSKQ